MIRAGFALVLLWIVLGWLSAQRPELASTAIGGGIGATVSVGIHLATRARAMRQTTLDLFAEYYSADFGAQRRAAERFMKKHQDVDWSRNDPYDIGANDDDLAGYGAVLRYWQRVATLFDENEVSRGLLERLLSRELGYWMAIIFEPMEPRKGMYVRRAIVELARRVAIGKRPNDYVAGRSAGLRDRPPEHEADPDTR